MEEIRNLTIKNFGELLSNQNVDNYEEISKQIDSSIWELSKKYRSEKKIPTKNIYLFEKIYKNKAIQLYTNIKIHNDK